MSHPLRLALGALLTTTALLALASPVRALDPTPADPSPTASPSTTTPATVVLDTIDPKAPTPTDTLHLEGRILNGDLQLDNLTLSVRIGQSLSRFDLHRLQGAPETPPGIAGTPIHLSSDSLAPHATLRFRFDLPLDGAPYVSTDGVHAMAVVVRATTGGAAAADTEVGEADTFLPVFHDNALPEPTQILWAVPVAGLPQAQPRGAISDPSVLDLLGDHGRLSRVLTAASKDGKTANGVLLQVDPDLLRALDLAATDTWKLPGSDETHEKSPSAAGFLAALRKAAITKQLMALPTADADIVSLAETGLTAEASLAIADGQAGVAKVLGTDPRGDVIAPVDGTLASKSASYFGSGTVTTLLLNHQAMPPLADLSYTPTALAHVHTSSGDLSVLVADEALNALVARAEKSAPTPRMAEQLFLAETAMITAQRPGIQQALLITAPREWDPGTRYGRATIADSAAVPWLQPSTVDEIEAGLDESASRSPLTASATDLLPASILNGIATARTELRQLKQAFSPGAKDSITSDPAHALFAAESARWRGDETEALTRSSVVERAVAGLKDSVRAAAPKVVTLTSADSPIPVTVINELAVPVTVKVNVEAVSQSRLGSRHYGQTVDVPARSKMRVDVPVSVQSSGTFPVNVWVTTPNGDTLGAPSRFVVRSAAYGKVALIITGGGVVLLFIAVGIRGVRRLRNRGRGDEATT